MTVEPSGPPPRPGSQREAPPRRRPPWWPEGEAFPPAGPGTWRAFDRGRAWGRRRRRAAPFGCFVIVAGIVVMAIIVLALSLLALLFGGPAPQGEAAHMARTAATILVVVLILAIATGATMGGRVVRPVSELIEAARRIEAGDYGVRVTQPRRPRELGDLAAAFNTMAARLEAEEANRRRLLADLSHELRTPIAVIEGHLEAILDGVYPADAAHLDPILDETRVLDRLIDDLRTLSLAEAGALALHREATDLGHVVADAAATMTPRAEAAGATIETNVEAGLPELDIDPVRIHQVLGNLLDNAIRYTPPDGTVTVTARRREGVIEVVVADQGPGLAPEVRASLFDRFAKAKDSPGSGLGLAIAKAIVEAHGGTIRADPGANGLGTVVSFQLPLRADA